MTQVLRPVQDLFPAEEYPDLLVGLGSPDDAAVYRLDADRALIVTNDFFTPIVDDPYEYGAIAAANSLSDVYAMGGRPLLALSIVAFPLSLPAEILTEVMRGLAETVRAAGAVIAGGHSIQDNEPKVGLCVIGLGHPDRLLTKGRSKPGDLLILTKPLGSGIITTAAKVDQVSATDLATAIGWMKRLNRNAGEVALELKLASGTDITGFGLLGHALEMAESADVNMQFWIDNIPFMEGVRRYAGEWLFPAGAAANDEAYSQSITFAEDITTDERMLLFDPQTSGGLLLAVPTHRHAEFAARMASRGEPFWTVGSVVRGRGIGVSRRRG